MGRPTTSSLQVHVAWSCSLRRTLSYVGSYGFYECLVRRRRCLENYLSKKADKYRESKFIPCRCFSAALTLRLDGGSQAPRIERDT
jgi:hypothetical protein